MTCASNSNGKPADCEIYDDSYLFYDNDNEKLKWRQHNVVEHFATYL